MFTTAAELVVVDLANMRVGPNARLLNRWLGDEKEAFVPSDVWLFMQHLESLNLPIPIVYLLDHGVKFHKPTPRDTELLKIYELADRFDKRKVWRSAPLLKSDEIIFRLHNTVRTIVISRDWFSKDEDSIGAQRHELVRFSPSWNSERDEFDLNNFSRREVRHLSISEMCRDTPVTDTSTHEIAVSLIEQMLVNQGKVLKAAKGPRKVAALAKERFSPRKQVPTKERSAAELRPIKPAVAVPQSPQVAPNDQQLTKPAPRPRVVAKSGVRIFLVFENALPEHEGKHVTLVGRYRQSAVQNYALKLSWFGTSEPIYVTGNLDCDAFTDGQFVEVNGFLRRGPLDHWVLDGATAIDVVRSNTLLGGGPLRQQVSYESWGPPPPQRRFSIPFERNPPYEEILEPSVEIPHSIERATSPWNTSEDVEEIIPLFSDQTKNGELDDDHDDDDLDNVKHREAPKVVEEVPRYAMRLIVGLVALVVAIVLLLNVFPESRANGDTHEIAAFMVMR